MSYELAPILALIICYSSLVWTKKECSNGDTYYSAIIKDCVACPKQSMGCTETLNEETVDNCLNSCITFSTPRKTTANPTEIQGHHAQSVGIKNPVLISITATAVFVLFIVSAVIGRKFYKRRQRIMVNDVDDLESNNICEEGGPVDDDQNYNILDSGNPLKQDTGTIISN